MNPFAGLAELVRALDTLELEYLVGGSLASSHHGPYRATADVDLVVVLAYDDPSRLAEQLAQAFYMEPDEAEKSLRCGRPFQLLHHSTLFKFDLFPARPSAWTRAQFARREEARIEGVRFLVASAEDTVLSKLVWFRQGNEVSTQQIRDVRGVIQVRRAQLDLAYLRHWAAELAVTDLLEPLLTEAGLEG